MPTQTERTRRLSDKINPHYPDGTCEALVQMRTQIAEGFVEGIRQLSEDKDFMEKFWKQGYTELSSHVTDGTSLWIGRRIWVAFLTVALTTIIALLVKTGAKL